MVLSIKTYNMKSIKLISAFFFYFISSFSYSQGEFLIEIDTATGSYNQIGGAISGIGFVFPYVRAYDETNGAYIFQGGASLVDHLYSIDVTNGSIISNPYFAPSGSSVREPKYDNIKDTLYGLYWNSSLSQFFLASINPTTGIYTQVGTIPIMGLGGISQGATAYDEINHRYFALQNNQLFSIDASNGNLISNPILNTASGEQLLHFCYNNSLNILYGLLQNSNTQICYLVSINTISGVMTKIGNGSLFGIGGGSSSIDKIHQRYMYIYTTGGSTYYITNIDIATGNIIANKLIPLSNGDNIHSIAFDNIKGKLYGIQWDANTTTNIIENGETTGAAIYPNPTNGIFNLQMKKVENVQIEIYNVYSECVYKNKIISSNVQIDLSFQAMGVYFLQIKTEQGIVYKKLIVQQ